MNTEELRKEFEGWAESNCYILDLDEDGDYENNLTFSAFEAYQAAKAQPQWIPVSERLPKHGQYVLSVSMDGRIYKSMAHITTEGRCMFQCALVVWEHSHVTHWMPLPPTPEDGK